jgi:hypothetical protein
VPLRQLLQRDLRAHMCVGGTGTGSGAAPTTAQAAQAVMTA